MGLPELPQDGRFKTNGLRVKNREALIMLLEEKTKTCKVKELQQILDRAGVPNGPIWSVGQALNSEQAQALEMVKEIDHPTCGKIKITGIPVKLSLTPGEVKIPPPVLGEHTEEILTKILGYTKLEVEKLKQEKVI